MGLGRDYTLFSLIDGVVVFDKNSRMSKVSVVPFEMYQVRWAPLCASWLLCQLRVWLASWLLEVDGAVVLQRCCAAALLCCSSQLHVLFEMYQIRAVAVAAGDDGSEKPSSCSA